VRIVNADHHARNQHSGPAGQVFGGTIAMCGCGGITQMLHWTLVFLIIALIAGALGFFGIAGTAAGIAKILFFVFLVLWLVGFVSSRRSI
jgi:uncharacterized membrane protein YtjA (UPF0391 family)